MSYRYPSAKRIAAIKLMRKGWSTSKTAKEVGASEASIKEWFNNQKLHDDLDKKLKERGLRDRF